MVDLDQAPLYLQGDPSGLRYRLQGFPQQCRRAWQQALAFELPWGPGTFDGVLVLGMGGSAIGGSLLRSLALAESPIPVEVWRDYDLPALVSPRTLVVASSYSGNTEEVLSALAQALEHGARILALTTGGAVARRAQEHRLPCFTFDLVSEPRSALGFGLLPLVAFGQRLGWLKDKRAEVQEALEILHELVTRLDTPVPTRDNPAKALAWQLQEALPVIYGGGFLAEVARRWKTQINENSKTWAFFEVLPELNHNAISGYTFPQELARRVHVVLLHSTLLHPRTLLRYKLTRGFLTDHQIAHTTIEAKGSSPLSQMLSSVLFGDYVSYYLALLYGVDPAPVPAIDRLKEQMEDA